MHNKRSMPNTIVVLVVVWIVLVANALIFAVIAPSNQVIGPVELSDYPSPGVTVEMVLPQRLETWNTTDAAQVLTLYVTPHRPDVEGVSLVFALGDRSVVLTDVNGQILSGPIEVSFQYPAEMILPLYVATAATGEGSGLLSFHTVSLNLYTLRDGVQTPVDGLGTQIALSSRLGSALRRVNDFLTRIALPIMAILTPFVLLGNWWAKRRQRQTDAQKALDARYVFIRELVDAGQIVRAREAAALLRREAPNYARIDHLDEFLSTLGSAELTASSVVSSNTESTLDEGIKAYKARDWELACGLLHTAQATDEYNPHLQFLYRTSCLYLALSGRDRSKRIAALRELGEIGDLVDLVPIVDALDDANSTVAKAAEETLLAIGPVAFDALARGLKNPSQSIKRRSRNVLASLGQDIREQLLSLLHTRDAELVAIASELLIGLGAREQLADALLWADPTVLDGIVRALVSDEIVALQPLLDVLLRAPSERQPYVLAAIGELKKHVNIDRRIEDMQRSVRDGEKRNLLGRALRMNALDYDQALVKNQQVYQAAQAD